MRFLEVLEEIKAKKRQFTYSGRLEKIKDLDYLLQLF